MAVEVENQGVAALIGTVEVGAFAVASGHIGLVFDGAGNQHVAPGIVARIDPVGGHDECVVVIGARAVPDGEADIVANRHFQSPAAKLHDG